MKLSPARFNAHLRHLGQRALWRPAHACPCRHPHSQAAQPGCAQCAGKGWWWATAVATHLALTGAQRQRQWAQMGLYEAGDVVISLPSDEPVYDLGPMDRIVLTDSSDAFSIILTRGRDDHAWPWPLAHIDALRFFVDAVLVDCQWPPPDPEDPPQTPAERWPTPAALLAAATPTPPLAGAYAITGRKYPEYFVWGDLVQTRHHHDGAALPRHVVLRRFDLFGR